MLWWKTPCVFANVRKKRNICFQAQLSLWRILHEVCQPTLFLLGRVKTTTKSSYLLNIAQITHIKPNTLETLSNCSHPSRAQSQYRANLWDECRFYVYKHNSHLNWRGCYKFFVSNICKDKNNRRKTATTHLDMSTIELPIRLNWWASKTAESFRN